MPGSMFPETSTEETERSKNGKGFKGPGGEHIKKYEQLVMSVRTPEGLVRKSTWQVADVRRPLVSASHIIQAMGDLFIGKDEDRTLHSTHHRRTFFSYTRHFINAHALAEDELGIRVCIFSNVILSSHVSSQLAWCP